MAQAICLSPSSLAIHVGWPSYRTSQLCAAEAYTGETCLVDDGDGGVGLAKVDTKNGRLGPVDCGERMLFRFVCLHFEKRSGNVNVFVDEDVFARNVNEETIFKISQHVVATST